MMNIEVTRYGFGIDSTLGTININGGIVRCFSLEDERRITKVDGETCIPVGTYEVKLRDAGGMTEKYRAKFPEMHRGMLWLQDVPDFEYIYIHIGNTPRDTLGCILVGSWPNVSPGGEFTVSRSTEAYEDLYSAVLKAMDAGERVVVHVQERTP